MQIKHKKDINNCKYSQICSKISKNFRSHLTLVNSPGLELLLVLKQITEINKQIFTCIYLFTYANKIDNKILTKLQFTT